MAHPERTTMKALQIESYGKPLDVLKLNDVAVPTPGIAQVRVRVHACARSIQQIGPCARASCPCLPRAESDSMSQER